MDLLRHRLFALTGIIVALGLTPATQAQTKADCPAALPAGTECHTGQDANGAWYLIAIPANWASSGSRTLVMHAHGGPDLGAPTLKRSIDDVTRWAITVKAGYAWAGSSYRRGGYGVRMAAEDTENLRKIFIAKFGQPRRTLMHGQSWGGNVGAKVIELYNNDGPVKNYDGAMLTSGVLGGGTRGYDYRMDLRVVYQHFCANHPRADEPQYPLWMGLPPESKLNPAALRERVNECTGNQMPAEKRSTAQQRNLANILNVTRIPEQTLGSHLNWATFTFADIVHKRLGGRNPFSTDGVQYTGSDDDAALNKNAPRYKPDPAALAELADDSDLTGRINIPVLTLHAIGDPTAFVEHESALREVYQRAGTTDRLVQTFSTEHEHSYLSTPAYAALMASLLEWVDAGKKPDAKSVDALCGKMRVNFGDECRFDVNYKPLPYESRVYSRRR